jgi:uncharacterized LabA/DUF88 family protein
MVFVDGSNLFGTLRELGLEVDDYEVFYRGVFSDVVEQWTQATVEGVSPPAAQLRRVYWYVVGSIDEWDLADPKAQTHLKSRFDENYEVKKPYLELAGKKRAGESQEQIDAEAWALCFSELKDWYDRRLQILDGMKRFYYAVRSSTDFIDISECGHWKVDFFNRSLSEKGLDATLAVDMLALMDSYDVAIVLSGDADSIPSINHVKRENKQVVTVEFVGGYPPERRGRGFSSRLKLSADLVVRIYESELVNSGRARREEGDTAGAEAAAPADGATEG